MVIRLVAALRGGGGSKRFFFPNGHEEDDGHVPKLMGIRQWVRR
jgi:hypothetical protein